MPDATKDREAYEEATHCWTKAQTILQQWDATPEYWNNRYTSKEVFWKYVASAEGIHTDFLDAELLLWYQSDAHEAKFGNSSGPAASTNGPDDLGCGTDTVCQAMVRHAMYMDQKCQEIDCIGIGNDVVGLAATVSIAAACIPGAAACASVAAVAGPIGALSTIGGVGWSVYSWSNNNATTTDLTVTYESCLFISVNEESGTPRANPISITETII